MEKQIQEIASYIQAEILGDPHHWIEDIKSVTFISDPKKLKESSSKVIITNQKVEKKENQIFLIVENPKLSFAKVLELFERPKDIRTGVDHRAWVEESAEVDPTATIYPFSTVRKRAKIGKNVILYPGVYVGQDVTIQEDCIVYPRVTLFPGTLIGKRVLIHAGAVIGDDGFGYVWDGTKHYKIPQVGRVVIEDDVEIGALAAIDRATTGETKIKQGTKIDNLVQVGHNVHIGAHCILCGQVGLAGSSSIGDGSMLGGQSGVSDHIQVGPMNKIAAQSGVLANTLPNTTLVGFPAMSPRDFFRIAIFGKEFPELKKIIKKLQKEIEILKQSKN